MNNPSKENQEELRQLQEAAEAGGLRKLMKYSALNFWMSLPAGR